jgi:hypothetical protein
MQQHGLLNSKQKQDESPSRVGKDPDVGDYVIDLNQPDQFELDAKAKQRFSAHKMGYHLDDENEREHYMMDDMYGEEEEAMDDEKFRGTGGLSSVHLDIIQEREDEDHTNSVSKSNLSRSGSKTKSLPSKESPPQT